MWDDFEAEFDLVASHGVPARASSKPAHGRPSASKRHSLALPGRSKGVAGPVQVCGLTPTRQDDWLRRLVPTVNPRNWNC